MLITVQFMELPKSSEKPCRACMSVEELMKRARELASKVKAKADTSNGASPSNSIRQEVCALIFASSNIPPLHPSLASQVLHVRLC